LLYANCLLGCNRLLYINCLLGYNFVKSGAMLFLFLPLCDATLLYLPLCIAALLFLLLPVAACISAAHIFAAPLCVGLILLLISVSKGMLQQFE
jgi:hypothetical protein